MIGSGTVGCGRRTSNSFKVNICFKITTLSHLEAAGLRAGSSSSQSASLLNLGFEVSGSSFGKGVVMRTCSVFGSLQ